MRWGHSCFVFYCLKDKYPNFEVGLNGATVYAIVNDRLSTSELAL